MITVRLMGGLGNQLFQVAGALYLALIYRFRVKCDVSWYATRPAGGETTRDLEVIELLHESERSKTPRLLRAIVYKAQRNSRLLRESSPADDVLQRVPAKRMWVEGYFQRSKYPLAVQDELAQRLRPVLDGLPDALPLSNSIGVHIRLGDYYQNPSTRSFHGLTHPMYFANALDFIRAEVGELPVVVFTDSPEVLKNELSELIPLGAEIVVPGDGWATLRDMSMCRGLVMSNSSLSWWAAFVGGVLYGRTMSVVMPTPWFSEKSSADGELRIPGWMQVPRIVAP